MITHPRIRPVVLSMLGLVAAVPDVFAQRPRTPSAMMVSTAPEQPRQEVVDRLGALRVAKITRALGLDAAAAARLFPLLARFDERKLRLREERREIVRALRSENAAATPDGGRLTAGVDRLLANRAKRHALDEEKFRELRRLLTPAQQVKLVLLLPRIERGHARQLREGARADAAPAHLQEDGRRKNSLLCGLSVVMMGP